ncbi:hypothetical protein [Streptomyces sviceus]|uniref:hypothetical protein n=1 Tax=Streptomyces sviceus TaxID=285530 RepID=UPI0036ACA3AB
MASSIALSETAGLAASAVPSGQRPAGVYLYQRCNEGCTDAARLHAEITEDRHLGSKRTVHRHLERIRVSGKPAPEKPKELTVRKAAWLVTAHPDKIDEINTQARTTPVPLPGVGCCCRLRARLRPDDD